MSSESHKTGVGQALECIDLVWDGSSKEYRSQKGGTGEARASVEYLSWPKASRWTLMLREKVSSGLVKRCSCVHNMLLVGVSNGFYLPFVSTFPVRFSHFIYCPSLYCILPSLSHCFHIPSPLFFSLFHYLCPLFEFSHSFLLCTAFQILHLCLNSCSYSFTTYTLRFLLTVFPSSGHSTVIYSHSLKSQNDSTLQP